MTRLSIQGDRYGREPHIQALRTKAFFAVLYSDLERHLRKPMRHHELAQVQRLRETLNLG